MTSLPQASPEALATSYALTQHIAGEIAAADGWIPFSRYMELALYAPGLGYYAAGSAKLGAAGDFTTAPEMTALFGATLARQIAELLPQTAGVIYEFGAGTGKLAADILQKLEQLGTLPERYIIIDLSADLIDRQKTLLQSRLPHLLDRVQWLAELPATLDGIVIGNEVLDAMPCEVLLHDGQRVLQHGVSLDNGGFVLADRPLDHAGLAGLASELIPAIKGYNSEISLSNRAFIRTLAERLSRGALLFIDYGFPAHEYYHPQRHMGTL
ncbi:class I SAM-dependent methyltransferase, partial [Craterilacuibacter sp.]|uniref:class I SAM-dependent methyltransferase n=1 Tax=Craterilacuibacter sp. TaxID=2870909 RepID=UPI003F2A9A12